MGRFAGPTTPSRPATATGYGRLGRKQHRMLECREAIYLRVTTSDGQRECIGPYECLKVAGGAVFSNETYLGAHTRGDSTCRRPPSGGDRATVRNMRRDSRAVNRPIGERPLLF